MSVEIRVTSEDDKLRTESLGRFDRPQDTEERTAVSTLVISRDADGSGELCDPRSPLVPLRSFQPMRTERAPVPLVDVDHRRRQARDLHDGVQNELVALIVKLARAQEDPDTPRALGHMLAELEAHAQAALDSVREIGRGSNPPLLAHFGLREALRAQAARAAISVSLVGTPPRSTAQAEEAVYFSCSEAIQNAAKHAGHSVQVTLRLEHQSEALRVRIADDGRGFDPARTAEGAGLRNIRGRIEAFGGSFEVASRPGVGTVLAISLPWPAAANGRP